MSPLGRAAAFCLLMVTSYLGAVAAPVQRSIEYANPDGESLRLDAYLPSGKGPFPALVIVHGGGWIGGHREYSVAPLFEPLTKAGFACFSISYRLASDFFQFGVAVDDVSSAVRFVRARAEDFKVDVSRIALLGESAGAHLASLSAMRDPKSVAAVVALYSPSDLESLALTTASIPEQVRQAANAIGVGPLILTHLRSLSPIQHVRSGLPPFLLMHGTSDSVVPFEQSVRLQEKLKAAGVDCELVAVKGGGHGIRGWERSPAHARYQAELIGWLRRHLPAHG